MNTNADYQPSRMLPSIDWIALSIGVLGLALSRIHGTGWGSWIGLLVVSIFVFLNKTLYPIIAEHPDAISHNVRFFPIDFLRQSLVFTFLFSYLIQYWGALDGVFRIMLGIAGLTLLDSTVPGSLDTQLGILRSAVQIFMVFGAIGLSLVKSGTEN